MAKLGHEIQFHSSQIPLASELIVVLVTSLLNSDVGQVHKRILEIIDIGRVTSMSEPAKAFSIQVNSERRVASYEHINTQIKLLTSN